MAQMAHKGPRRDIKCLGLLLGGLCLCFQRALLSLLLLSLLCCCLCSVVPWGLAWPEKALPELPSRGLSCHHSVFTTDSYMAVLCFGWTTCSGRSSPFLSGRAGVCQLCELGQGEALVCASWVGGWHWCAPAVRVGSGGGAGVRQPC